MVENQRQALKVLQYVYNTKTALNFGALFADGTDSYRHPAELKIGDSVTLWFRTGRNNVDAVYLVYNGERCNMQVESSDELFDYYAYTISEVTDDIDYYYMALAGNVICYYNKLGTQKDLNPDYNFQIAPGFSVPKWARGAVFYQIFVDRFYNGDPSNDVEDNEYCYIGEGTRKVKDWFKYPDNMDVRSFYGGDLQGVMDKLDYLQGLGVDVIYLNPIFVSPSNHKYDIQDYDYVDPHFGKIVKDGGECLPEGCKVNKEASKYIMRVTDKANLEASNELFAQLVEEIHKRGMRVILDGVFNHCGSFNKWLDRERIYENQPGYEKGAFISGDSPYHSFFKFHNEHCWPYNEFYDGWWGHNTLPKLNYENSEKLYEDILRIAKKWVSAPFYVDGWRLDVAADLGHSAEYNHKFWRQFRKVVKEANPEAIIIAEHYGDASPWLQGDQWDTVMNYDAFMEPISWFLTGLEKHSDQYRQDLKGNAECFRDSMRYNGSRFYAPSLLTAMNELDNHDHSRFLTRTNSRVGRINTVGARAAEEGINKAILREAVAIQMTWPGAPTVYYGDEAGVCGFTDPDNRRTFPWGNEDKELQAFHKEVIRIHKEEKPLKKGSIKLLASDENLLAYGRFEADEQIVIVVNNSDELRTVTVPVWYAGVEMEGRMKRLIYSYENGYTTEYDEYIVQDGEIVLNMGSHSAIVLKPAEALRLMP